MFIMWQLASCCHFIISSCGNSHPGYIIISSCGNSHPGHFIISSCGNSHPGHGTKFVTLPSSILLYEFYIKAGSMYLKICYCSHYLMW